MSSCWDMWWKTTLCTQVGLSKGRGPCQEVTGRIWDKQTWYVLFQPARLYVLESYESYEHMHTHLNTHIYVSVCFFFVWRSYRNSSNLSIPFPFPMIGSLKWLGDFPTTVTAWSSVFSKGFNQFLSAVCADYSSFLVLCYPVVGWRFMHAILIFHDHDSWRRIRWSTPRCPEISQQVSYNWNQLNISANHTPSPGS